MSFWGKLAGIGTAAAGVVTGNPALIAAGGTVLAGDVASEGAKKASAQQVAATEKAQAQSDALYGGARDEQRRVFDASSANFAPYIALGHGTLGNLGSMVGLERSQAPTMSQSTPYAPQSLASLVPGEGRPVVDPEGLRPAQAAMANASGYGKNDRSEAIAGRGLVRVEAPDGELAWLPRARADEAVARGARVLG